MEEIDGQGGVVKHNRNTDKKSEDTRQTFDKDGCGTLGKWAETGIIWAARRGEDP